MSRNQQTALQSKVIQIVFGLGALCIFLFVTRSMMQGSTMLAKFLVIGIIGMVTLFFLDERYWLISSFLFGFQDTLPVVKFTGMELGALVLIVMFFIRHALHRDVVFRGSKALVVAAVPFLVWMCLVWYMNPVGMFIFGSSTMGGRFYLKVLLAFFSMLCLSSIPFSEKWCKEFLVAFVLGNVACVIRSLFGSTEQLFVAGETNYQYAHLYYVAMFFLARYSAIQILSRSWVFLGFLVSFGLTVYSGNRHSVGEAALFGLVAPLVLKRERFRTFLLMGVACVVLGFGIAGQGRLWNLPFSVQRSLSFLPGKWSSRLESYGFNDNFRATLRMYAREHIAERPWFGDGGFSLDYSEMAWVAGRGGGDMYSGHILSRNWHNVWLGMAADFGIPLSLAWAIFSVSVLLWGFKKCREFPPGNWSETAFLYFYLVCAVNFIDFFYAGGHTAKTPERWFVYVGAMAAVHAGFLRSRREVDILKNTV